MSTFCQEVAQTAPEKKRGNSRMSGFRFCFQNQGVPLRLDCGDDTPNSGLTLTSLGTKWHLDEKNFLVTEHGYYPGETKVNEQVKLVASGEKIWKWDEETSTIRNVKAKDPELVFDRKEGPIVERGDVVAHIYKPEEDFQKWVKYQIA